MLALNTGRKARVRGSIAYLDDTSATYTRQRLTTLLAMSAIAAAAMIVAVTHPRILAALPLTYSPMIRRLLETDMTTTRNGAAATPLMTATRTSNLIGLTCRRLSAVPPSVPRATRP